MSTNTDDQNNRGTAHEPTPPRQFEPTEINVNAQIVAADHGWKVLGTFVGFGSVGGLAYVIAQQGWADLAGTGIMLLFPFYTIQLLRNGLINIPTNDSGDERIEAGKSALRDIAGMIQAFITRSSYLRLFFISLAYMVGMLLFRYAAIKSLGIFQNWIISVCVFGLLSVFIIMPGLLGKFVRRLKERPGASK